MVAILLAPICAACRRPLDQPTRGAVCPPCWASIVPITPPCCRTCGDPLPSWRVLSVAEALCPRCRRRAPLVSLARAIGPYEGTLRAIVHALKYDGRPTLARHLAARMREAGADVLSGADLVVAVPLHRSRERARGFNQARELARHLGLPVADALTRTRRTPSQADLPAARRHANVRGAFAWRRGVAGEGADDRPRGRREHDGRDVECVRARAAGRGSGGRPRAYGRASRGATAVRTSAATTSFARSPSSRSQPSAAAWRR